MIDFRTARYITYLLTLFLAYLFTIAPVGFFRAWMAKKMGDRTAQELGFLSLNPLIHIDLFGLAILFLFRTGFIGVGWGRYIPINHLNIGGQFRRLKFSIALLSDTFAHLFLATASLIILILIFGVKSLELYQNQTSSLVISLARIIISFMYLNIFLTVISFIVNIVMIFALFLTEKYTHYSQYVYYIILLLPILLLFFFGGDLSYLLMQGIAYIGDFFIRLFGAG